MMHRGAIQAMQEEACLPVGNLLRSCGRMGRAAMGGPELCHEIPARRPHVRCTKLSGKWRQHGGTSKELRQM